MSFGDEAGGMIGGVGVVAAWFAGEPAVDIGGGSEAAP